jgi:hypothetical protein
MAQPTLDPLKPAFTYPSYNCSSAADNGNEGEGTKPLDPITVAGALNLGRIVALMELEPVAETSLHLAALQALRGGTLMNFLGCDSSEGGADQKLVGAALRTHPRYKAHLQYLNRAEVLMTGLSIKCWIRYFSVPTTPTHERAIMDCRSVNQLVRAPPQLLLVGMHEIVWALLLFSTPAMGSADFRHFFWQVPLASGDAQWFGIRGGKTGYAVRCMPMGFAWSPYLAQLISTILLVSRCAYSHDAWSGRPVICFRQDGELVAIGIIFYDNFLVVASSVGVRDRILDSFRRNVRSAGAVIKGCEGEDGGIVRSRTEVVFLGVRFQLTSTGLRWAHDERNINRWFPDLLSMHSLSSRDVYQRVGVIIWNATVGLSPMIKIANSLDIMAEVANNLERKESNGRKRWDEGFALSEAQQRCLVTELETIRQNTPFERVRIGDKQEQRIMLMATDASNWGGRRCTV